MMPYSVLESTVAWLSGLGYRASTTVPASPPGEFVTVERTGGAVEHMVDHPMLALQAWAGTEARAEELANGLRDAVLFGGRPRGVHSMRVSQGPYRFYDEDTRRPRYQLVVQAAAQVALGGKED